MNNNIYINNNIYMNINNIYMMMITLITIVVVRYVVQYMSWIEM